MTYTPYHLTDDGALVEVGTTAVLTAVGVRDLTTAIAWRCEKCDVILYSDIDSYGFRPTQTVPRHRRRSTKASRPRQGRPLAPRARR